MLTLVCMLLCHQFVLRLLEVFFFSTIRITFHSLVRLTDYHTHRVKSVLSVFSWIWTEYGKILENRDQKISEYGHFLRCDNHVFSGDEGKAGPLNDICILLKVLESTGYFINRVVMLCEYPILLSASLLSLLKEY